jgi:hypothetical protein
MAVVRAREWVVARGRSSCTPGFQVNVGGEAPGLATDANDIG